MNNIKNIHSGVFVIVPRLCDSWYSNDGGKELVTGTVDVVVGTTSDVVTSVAWM